MSNDLKGKDSKTQRKGIEEELENTFKLVSEHSSFCDHKVDDKLMADEEEPILIDLDYCAPKAAKTIVKQETYDKVKVDSTDDLDGPSQVSRRTSIFGASSTLRTIAGLRDRAMGMKGSGGLGDTIKSKKNDGPKIMDLQRL